MVPGYADDVDGMSFYHIERAVGSAWEPARKIFTEITSAFADKSASRSTDELYPDLAAVVGVGLERLLFVDLETCGFVGTPVFLIGVMYVEEGDLHTEQLLARSYSEESAIVARFGRLFAERPHLVSFNGKSFDWPFVAARAAAWRVELGDPVTHCDLLHAARRRYRDVLPDCRLQTLEQFICGRRRQGDIPGSEIPDAYHEFVRTGDAGQIREIINHNFLDLVTMADVLATLLTV